ncbi:hypothetical protein [Ignicoccus hospitalis]|uniref:hypothetical protein n=1 Tax=Ignicoccus hospitalis TaxID=160233 RepID=UPI00032505C3|nr:hypothetical protein [Ignicoccus hospitalis]HIH89817.1 hypothetical protein [Desulfurococcaceae archaeon]
MKGLGKRDPQGYYVIVAKEGAEDLLPPEALVERVGDKILIRLKSRSLALKVLRTLEAAGLLDEP